MSTGSQVHPGTIYWDSTYAGFYCDGGTGGTGTFRLDSPGIACWEEEGHPLVPAVAFYTATPTVVNPPTSPRDCRPGSWQHYTDDSGAPFTSKADCLAYFGIRAPHHGGGHHHRGHDGTHHRHRGKPHGHGRHLDHRGKHHHRR